MKDDRRFIRDLEGQLLKQIQENDENEERRECKGNGIYGHYVWERKSGSHGGLRLSSWLWVSICVVWSLILFLAGQMATTTVYCGGCTLHPTFNGVLERIFPRIGKPVTSTLYNHTAAYVCNKLGTIQYWVLYDA